MSPAPRIGLIGDHDEKVVAHRAIPSALELAGQVANRNVTAVWLPTRELGSQTDFSLFAGLWCVPASPYANMEGALAAIRFARETKLPFFGTCGGFQHAVIEYVRNALGKPEADHAESNPAAALPLISPLACSLLEATSRVFLKPDSKAARFYGRLESQETYHCRFGINPRFRSLLEESELEITGWDDAKEVRVVELKSHPFFMATLFQPERKALKGLPHPLIVAFVRSLTPS